MQTHEDADVQMPGEFMRRLQERADEMAQKKLSEITAGKDGEVCLDEWTGIGGINVVQRPDDEQGILRISVGGGIPTLNGDYCVFRGNRLACAALLERAARSLREGHRPSGANTPQGSVE